MQASPPDLQNFAIPDHLWIFSNSEILEETQVSIDSSSIDEEIDLTRNFDEEIDQTNYEDYKIYTSQFDEVINAVDIATPEETQRLRQHLDKLISPHLTTIGKHVDQTIYDHHIVEKINHNNI